MRPSSSATGGATVSIAGAAMCLVRGPSTRGLEPFWEATALLPMPRMALTATGRDHLHGPLWHLQYLQLPRCPPGGHTHTPHVTSCPELVTGARWQSKTVRLFSGCSCVRTPTPWICHFLTLDPVTGSSQLPPACGLFSSSARNIRQPCDTLELPGPSSSSLRSPGPPPSPPLISLQTRTGARATVILVWGTLTLRQGAPQACSARSPRGLWLTYSAQASGVNPTHQVLSGRISPCRAGAGGQQVTM